MKRESCEECGERPWYGTDDKGKRLCFVCLLPEGGAHEDNPDEC